MKKFVSLFLCLAMLFSMLVTTTMAEGNYNATMETNKTEVEAGGEFTVTIKNKAMTVSSFACGIFFDTSKLECMSITGALVANSYYLHNPSDPIAPYVIATGAPNVADSNTTGTVGFAWAGTVDTAYGATTIATVTFKVKADATGSADILLFEDSAGANGAKIGNGYDTYVEAKDDNTLDKDVVTIVAPTVSATGVELSSDTLSLDIGDTATLTATVKPADASNKTVTFVSSAPDVVQVVNAATGEIKGLKEGTATITVTTADGNFTDTCVVTVACSHANTTLVAEKDSDCTNQGWDAYSTCDDCGQIFNANGEEIDAIPFRPLDPNGHRERTPATCTAKAICDICGQPYGDLEPHSYTAADTKAEALKTAGNCRDFAVYYYSCSVCGAVEKNDNHTFTGEKDDSVHVGGTHVEGAADADHNTQFTGSTGATICDGCGDTLNPAQPIAPGAHVAQAIGWTTNETQHWKKCTVTNDCPHVFELDNHSSTGANVATCQKAAVCDVCGVSYGEKADHVPANTWSKDASGHWYDCQYNCGEKINFGAHNPDKQGGATEEYGIFCTECNYEIETQLEHTHNFNQMNTDDDYLVSAATCSSPAVYKYSCSCGAEGTETFVDPAGTLDPDNHNWDSAWSGADNPDNHWHACLNGCGEKNDVTGHDYKMKSDSTKHWEQCDVCGRKINEGNHIDTDKDDECDTCGRDMLKPGPGHFGHWDYNGDGRCDYCGAKTGCTHTDANGDGKCDNCSAAMKVQSSQTFDAGVLMYAGMAVLAATGSAAMIGKKRKEQ